jgi:hypothetical protein
VKIILLLGAISILETGLCSADNLQSAPATSHQKAKIVYVLDWESLNRLADKLGFKIEARGMGIYVFARKGLTFTLSQHPDIDSGNADSPLELAYQSPDGNKTVEAKLDLSGGKSPQAIESFFRQFVRRIE